MSNNEATEEDPFAEYKAAQKAKTAWNKPAWAIKQGGSGKGNDAGASKLKVTGKAELMQGTSPHIGGNLASEITMVNKNKDPKRDEWNATSAGGTGILKSTPQGQKLAQGKTNLAGPITFPNGKK